MELKPNMYIRYIPTIGQYTQKISKITKTKNCLLDMCYTLDDKEEVFSSHFDDILKASNNVLDLIEVGDFIDGKQVVNAIHCKDGFNRIELFGGKAIMNKTPIKSVVTKEMFSSVEYRVETN